MKSNNLNDTRIHTLEVVRHNKRKQRMHRLNKIYLSIFLSTLFTFGVSWADDLPSWLSGKPDIIIVKERSALYDWVLNQADKQTNGLASQEGLAKKRLIIYLTN